MSNFVKPKGINFSTSEMNASNLSKTLCKTVSFIQNIDPYAKIDRFDDWWEHDGLHFHKCKVTFDELFQIVNSPKNLLNSMQDDFNVFVGIAPEDNSWYLRFLVAWDENEEYLVGRFDITVPTEIAESYENSLLYEIKEITRQTAEDYYYSLIS